MLVEKLRKGRAYLEALGLQPDGPGSFRYRGKVLEAVVTAKREDARVEVAVPVGELPWPRYWMVDPAEEQSGNLGVLAVFGTEGDQVFPVPRVRLRLEAGAKKAVLQGQGVIALEELPLLAEALVVLDPGETLAKSLVERLREAEVPRYFRGEGSELLVHQRENLISFAASLTSPTLEEVEMVPALKELAAKALWWEEAGCFLGVPCGKVGIDFSLTGEVMLEVGVHHPRFKKLALARLSPVLTERQARRQLLRTLAKATWHERAVVKRFSFLEGQKARVTGKRVEVVDNQGRPHRFFLWGKTRSKGERQGTFTLAEGYPAVRVGGKTRAVYPEREG